MLRISLFFQFQIVFLIGIAGATRKIELLKLSTEHAVDYGDYLTVDVPDTKTNQPRQFVVTPGSVNGMDFLGMLRSYCWLGIFV